MDSRDDDSKQSHLALANALAIVALWSGALLACVGLSGMTIGGSGLGLLSVTVAAAEEVQAPPADDGPPLAAEHHPPPVVNIIPRKPKSTKDSSSKTSDAKDSAKEKVKKAALRKTKGR